MAFLRNRAVNWLNLHVGIQALAQGMGGVFVLVFLLRAGVSVPASLCAMALLFGSRFAIRPLVLPVTRRVGLKPVVIGGGLVVALGYQVLAGVTGANESLLAYCFVSSLGETFYWTAYHAYFSRLGDNEHRGHQISANVAISALAGIVAPLLGAWLLGTFGPRVTFAVVGAVQVASLTPLIVTPNVRIPAQADGALRAALPGVGLFLVDGWFSVTYYFVWQIALYLALGANLAAYGGAMALAALVGAVTGLLLGRHIDAGGGRRATFIALGTIAGVVTLRALSLDTPWLAVSANALGAFAACLLGPVQMVPVYNLAAVSPCALRFHIAAEGGWDVGCATGCLTAAALIASGAPLASVIPLAFVGLLGMLLLLRRYYLRLALW